MSQPVRPLLISMSIVLVGINLRPILASIGPLLDVIQRDTGLNDSLASLLTTLPVALMGICLLGASKLRRVMSDRNGIFAGLILISIACAARAFIPSSAQLLLTAIIGGIGIAIIQALIPFIIRAQNFQSSASLMGIYSTAIMGGALLASSLAPWISDLWGLQPALSLWALPALMALIFWMKTPDQQRSGTSRPRFNLYKFSRAWALLVFFGLATGAYTLVLAWLPPFFMQLGWSAKAAGALLGFLTAAEVVAGIAISLLVGKFRDRRIMVLAALTSLLAGLISLCIAPLYLAWPAAILAGLGIGALFPLSLIVALDHGENNEAAGAIVNFVQGGGYILAASLPFAAGIIRQSLSDLTPAWWLMAALCLVLMILASRFRPDDHIIISNS
ncbi:MFS transporter [Brucella pseudogrignonensis]|uniref:CP family cyanate transporter-like MFS transporter n=1 Tax=Brucella pseudogrignonensis TaxID=419475 RepID=A0ABU1MBJ0_9HYPH|nr:MFS transporter [Brucella pseudogrignonensis]MDR6433212.1 CP family cyanate transporter-like MFS transporter [Brucella pseudogrignonensis]